MITFIYKDYHFTQQEWEALCAIDTTIVQLFAWPLVTAQMVGWFITGYPSE